MRTSRVFGAFVTMLNAIEPRATPPIALALRQAADQLPAGANPKSIVLVSDGEDTCGEPPCDVAAELHRSHPGLVISTIGFRTEAMASAELRCIAAVTGGLFASADNVAPAFSAK